MIGVIRAPDTGLGGDVEDDVATARGSREDRGVGEVGLEGLDAECAKFGIIAAGDAPDGVATSQKLSDDRRAKESAAAGDECFQRPAPIRCQAALGERGA